MSCTEQEWPVKVLSATGTPYPWPYGTRALISERELVQHMHNLSESFKYGYRLNHYVNDDRIFTVPLSFEDCFIDSHDQRVILMDRVRTFYNFNWKRDAVAHAVKTRHQNLLLSFKQQADDIFKKLMENLMLLQALTEELNPQTRAVARQCTSFEQLHRCMLDAGV